MRWYVNGDFIRFYAAEEDGVLGSLEAWESLRRLDSFCVRQFIVDLFLVLRRVGFVLGRRRSSWH